MTCCINLFEKHGVWKKEGLRKNEAKAFTWRFLRQHQRNMVLQSGAWFNRFIGLSSLVASTQ